MLIARLAGRQLALLAHEPVYGAPEALIEADLSLPAEHTVCFRGIGVVAADFPAAGGGLADFHLLQAGGGEGGEKFIRKFLDGRFGARGDLEDFAADAFRGGREADGTDQVVHEDEVAGLGAVAVDLQHLAVHRPFDEPRYHAVLVAGKGTVDVAEAQRDGTDAEGMEVRRAVALTRELARPVRGDRVGDHLLVYRGLRLPYNRPPARSEHEATHAIVAGRFQKVQRADHVAHAIGPGIFYGGHHPRVGGEVHDHVGALGGSQRQSRVLYVADDELDPLVRGDGTGLLGRDFDEVACGCQVFPGSYGQVIHHPDPVAALLHEGPDQGRPDKAAAARDQPVHEHRVSERVRSEVFLIVCMLILLDVVCRAYIRPTSCPVRV